MRGFDFTASPGRDTKGGKNYFPRRLRPGKSAAEAEADFKAFEGVSTRDIYDWLVRDGYFEKREMDISYARFHKIVKAVHARFRDALEHGDEARFCWGMGRAFVVLCDDTASAGKVRGLLYKHGISDPGVVSQAVKKTMRHYPKIIMRKADVFPARHVRHVHFYPDRELVGAMLSNWEKDDGFVCVAKEIHMSSPEFKSIRENRGFTRDFRKFC